MNSVRLRTLCACLALAVPALAQAAEGTLVIVGGALSKDNAPIYETILDARLPDRPLCVIPLASGVPVESAASARGAFMRHGGAPEEVVSIDLTTASKAHATDPGFAAMLRGCGGFYFTGGDQSRIIDVMRPGGEDTPAAAAVRAVFAAGGVVSGSSAGAAMMSDPMIAGGDPADAFRHPVRRQEAGRGIWVRGGMGFLEPAIVGQHFLQRGRLPRLLAALDAHPEEGLAFGIDENTGIVVRGDEVRVLGASGVVVVDARGAERDGTCWKGLRLTLLSDGDVFERESGAVHFAEDKRALAQAGRAKKVVRELWRDDVFHRALLRFARAGAESMTMPARGAELVLRRRVDTKTVAREDRGAKRVPVAGSAGPFTLDIVRER